MAKVYRDALCGKQCPEYKEFGEAEEGAFAYCETHYQWWESITWYDWVGNVLEYSWSIANDSDVPDHLTDFPETTWFSEPVRHPNGDVT